MRSLIVLAVILVGGCESREQAEQRKTEAARVEKAKRDVMELSVHLERYREEEGQYPHDLGLLSQPRANGREAATPPSLLRDPWSKRYEFDTKGPRNKGKLADVWTTTPNGEAIGNWP